MQDYRVQEYRLPSPRSYKCDVLRESLSEDSQNIPCATLKRRGSGVISVYLWKMHLLYQEEGSSQPGSPHLPAEPVLSNEAIVRAGRPQSSTVSVAEVDQQVASLNQSCGSESL